jgi:hypothetical protein
MPRYRIRIGSSCSKAVPIEEGDGFASSRRHRLRVGLRRKYLSNHHAKPDLRVFAWQRPGIHVAKKKGAKGAAKEGVRLWA